ncbi:hypothetical protein [Cellulomonas hominis]
MTVSTGAAAGGVRVHSPLALGLQFGGAALVWGASFFFMRVALDGVSWGQIALIRMLLGAATLAVIVVRMRARLPRSARVLGHFLVLGAVGSYIRTRCSHRPSSTCRAAWRASTTPARPS